MDMTTKQLFEYISREYSLILLNWAYKKTGNRSIAEDLAQETLLQVFSSIKKNAAKGKTIEKIDNFVWKIAHYVWCRYLRLNTVREMCISTDDFDFEDESDFANELADNEDEARLISLMRERIVRLNYLQREIMISYYIDGSSQREIARKLGIGEGAVKWHLFDTRKRLKKELTEMNNTGSNEFLYRPHTLHMAINGQAVPELDTRVISGSLTKQNICIACYGQPKTLGELTEMLNIPKAYIEFDLKWLTEREFVAESSGRYSTSFMIQTVQDNDNTNAVFLRHKAALSDVITHSLIESEDIIRNIGFYGSDMPMNRLLWLLIYSHCNYQYRDIPYFTDEMPIRPDGGRYFPLGFDRTEIPNMKMSVDTSCWSYNGSMQNDNFTWFGLYNFGNSDIESMLDEYTPEWRALHELLCIIIHSNYDISDLNDNQKFTLANLIEKGYVRLEGNKALPNFCVFTAEQWGRLESEVFAPIKEKVANEMKALISETEKLCEEKIPAQLKEYRSLFVKMAIADLAFLTTIFAFNDGLLYVPKNINDGEFLTLSYIVR